jgi:hypothetical protein
MNMDEIGTVSIRVTVLRGALEIFNRWEQILKNRIEIILQICQLGIDKT